MKRIVALGSYSLNPGDLTWDAFHKLGSFEAFPYATEEVENGAAREADALVIDTISFDTDRFARFPRLKYIGLFATGHDRIDLDAARHAGVAVTNVPSYSTSSVAQMTMALILNLAHRITEYDAFVHAGGWREDSQFVYQPAPLIELEGKALAVLGFGDIGTEVARRADAFGMRILGDRARKKPEVPVPVTWLGWNDLLAEADFITLHLPLTSGTRGLIDDSSIQRMKKGCIVVNTARGGLIDERALADALWRGDIGAAGLDVLGISEPPCEDNPLLKAPNCIITPHIAWATRESRLRCLNEAAENLRAFLEGRVRNRLV